MSSAILLVAIVAIWACALVPRWVRRSHETTSEPAVPADEVDPFQEHAFQPEASYEAYDGYGAEDGAYPELAGDYDEYPEAAGQADEDGEYPELAGQADEDGEYPELAGRGQDYDEYQPPAASEAEGYDYQTRPASQVTRSGDQAARRPGMVPHAHVAAGDHAGPGVLVGHLTVEDDADDFPRAVARPAPDREHVLRTRRTLLTALVLLFAMAFCAAVLSIAHWWLVAAAAGMLVFYLMLLRNAVHADAENAAQHAAAQARAAAARSARAAAAARERARAAAAVAAAAPQPTAEIIDIGERTARAGGQDEPYDQYTDATARAIGD